jgi:mannosyltransferase OCH1-like enzyme
VGRPFIFLLLICSTLTTIEARESRHPPKVVERVVESLLPAYDTRCDSMCCHTVNIGYGENLYAPVPKKVHQIWFGDKRNMPLNKALAWQHLCVKFGYDYKLWDESDIENCAAFMSSNNYSLLKMFLEQKNYWAASDILRCELIKKFGGIYSDCDILPPSIDPADAFHLYGLTLMTEKNARNVHASALFVANSFIIAPPEHPIMRGMVEQFYDNVMFWHSRQKNYDAMFVTGPFLLNKILSGSFNIVPITFLTDLGMCPCGESV